MSGYYRLEVLIAQSISGHCWFRALLGETITSSGRYWVRPLLVQGIIRSGHYWYRALLVSGFIRIKELYKRYTICSVKKLEKILSADGKQDNILFCFLYKE